MKVNFGDGTPDDIVMDYDERLLRLENQYSDDEILIEARRRGLLMRVEAKTEVPELYAEDGLTKEIQIENTFAQLADGAARECIRRGNLPAGASWGAGMSTFGVGPVRSLRMALNFVINPREAKTRDED
ncbi:hypothetical protein [Phaeobacter sp. S60]|uniref:hypothetical protein n=1 Tax=Phaeobacter sp. S60 TaxID=1569353 RepID=UPI00058F6B15|nr:hypothetical protein [Phaeobacter sp. S60]KII11274.1 hypothetical protein OO25_21860 [Phaeobacter sp. S60]